MSRNVRMMTLLVMGVCLLLLTSCAPEPTISEYGELNYPQLRWMMTPEEVFASLKTEESKAKKTETGSVDTFDYIVSYTVPGTFLSYDAEIELCFSKWNEEDPLTLRRIWVNINDASRTNYELIAGNFEEAQEIVSGELSAEFDRQQAEFDKEQHLYQIIQQSDGSKTMNEIFLDADIYDSDHVIGFKETTRLRSKALTTDLPQELKDQWQAGIDAFYEKHGSETMLQTLHEEPLTSVQVGYTEYKDDSAPTLQVLFDALPLCNVLQFTE